MIQLKQTAKIDAPLLLKLHLFPSCNKDKQMTFIFPQSSNDQQHRTKAWADSFTQSMMDLVTSQPLDFITDGRQNYIMKERFIGDQSRRWWCHYSTVIILYSQNVPHNNKLNKQKTCALPV